MAKKDCNGSNRGIALHGPLTLFAIRTSDGGVLADEVSLSWISRVPLPSEKVMDFDLSDATTDVRAKCMEVVKLSGDVAMGVRVLLSPKWFDAFTGHANVKADYANFSKAARRLGGDVRRGFTFGGITFTDCAKALGYELHWHGHNLTDGTVMFRDDAGAVFSVPFNDVWREPDLIARLSPDDAFRIGYECGTQRTREMIAAVRSAS